MSDLKWRAKADQLRALHAAGRRPDRVAATAAESALYTWNIRERLMAERGDRRSTPERQTYLDENLPGWRSGNMMLLEIAENSVWHRTVDELANFCDENGRWPRPDAAQPNEVRLAQFHLRFMRHQISAAHHAYLNTHLSGWDATGEDRWRARVDDSALTTTTTTRGS